MSLINVIDEKQMQENVNEDDETRITLGEELQRDNKEKCTKEGHLLKDVKEEEVYDKDLAKGERTFDDLSIIKEGMENCVKFPKSTPIEINELYRKLDFQRRELERQRIDVQERLLKREDKKIVINDSHQKKEMIMRVQQIDTVEGGVHYSGQKQRDIIKEGGMEERLMESLMNLFESSNKHTDMLIEDKETEQQTELLPKENKVQQPYVFNFNKCFVNVGFVSDAEGNFAQLNNQIKMREEDSME